MPSKPIRTILTALAACAFLSSPAGASGNPIKIGQAIDLSGPNGSLGRDYVAGIKTYFDMLNAAGGVNGRKLSYVVHDDKGTPEEAAKLVGELIEREQVDYLFGGVGDDVTRAVVESPAFQRSAHTLFAPLAASEFGEAGRVLFWRPSYLQEVRHVLAHFSTLGINSLAVAVQESPVAERALRALLAEIQTRGLKVSETVRIGTNGERAALEAPRVAASRPGFVMVIADTIGTGLFLKEFRKHAPQTFVAGTSLVNLETVRELAGAKAVEWTVFSQVVPNPGSAISLLQIEHLNMMRKYRDEPVSALTLEGFAAAKALTLSLQRARQPGLALRELFARGGSIDLGGLEIAAGNAGRLSNYLDIALFRKGGGLVF